MIGVEVITKGGAYGIENAVNKWLRDHPAYELIDIKLAGGGTGLDACFCAMIIYKH